MSAAQRAVQLKDEGNNCFKAQDYVGADKFYTQAIIIDPTSAAIFSNRALVRLRLQQWDAVIADCEHAISLLPTCLKAYTYLGQAHLSLNHPEAALRASLTAYDLAITQRSPSTAKLAQQCLNAKKAKWEASEEVRIRREQGLLADMRALIERDVSDKMEAERYDGDPDAMDLDVSEILEAGNERIKQLEEVFGKAEQERYKKREVPDYLIDNITFGVMLDPVITKGGHSYDRSTLLDHLKRSKTDPLTREDLTEEDLRPNLGLKEACETFLSENGWAVDW